MFELMLERHFSAAHHLLNYVGKCATPHGHNYKVRLYVQMNTLDDANIAMDFKDMKAVLDAILDRFDHQDLNTLPEFKNESPSAEFMARLIFREVRLQIPDTQKVCIYETDTQAVCYTEP
jgi:6-pyruvoyltetrahydropterin/6-carboxytetrahydropterin synthase